MRLRLLLPGQQAVDHCVCTGITKSTSFPRAVRKGKGLQTLGGGRVGRRRVAMKEDWSNKISEQKKEKGAMCGGGRGGRAGGCRGAP